MLKNGLLEPDLSHEAGDEVKLFSRDVEYFELLNFFSVRRRGYSRRSEAFALLAMDHTPPNSRNLRFCFLEELLEELYVLSARFSSLFSEGGGQCR